MKKNYLPKIECRFLFSRIYIIFKVDAGMTFLLIKLIIQLKATTININLLRKQSNEEAALNLSSKERTLIYPPVSSWIDISGAAAAIYRGVVHLYDVES